MPPLSQGKFRRKASEDATLHGNAWGELPSTEDRMAQSGPHQGWPNTKDDYELREVIGQ